MKLFKSFMIVVFCSITFGVFAQSTIQLSEISILLTLNHQGNYAFINNETLNLVKVEETVDSRIDMWAGSDKVLLMTFDITCKQCPAEVIRYKKNNESKWRTWIISSNKKIYGEVTSKILKNDTPKFPYSEKFIPKSVATGKGNTYMETYSGELLKTKLQFVFRGDEEFSISDDGGNGNIYWISKDGEINVYTVKGKITMVLFINSDKSWVKYFAE